MDPKTIGQQIKQTHPEYSQYSDQEIGTRYIQKYGSGGNLPSNPATDPQNYGSDNFGNFNRSIANAGSGISNFFRGIGLGIVPNLGGAIASLPQMAVSKIMERSNPLEAARLASVPNLLQTDPLAVRGNTQDQLGVIGRDLAGLSSWMMPSLKIAKGAGMLPAIINSSLTGAEHMLPYGVSQSHSPAQLAGDATIGAILGPILGWGTSGMMTRKGAARATETLADNSGARVSADALKSQIEKAVLEKYGDVPEVRSALNTIKSSLSPELPIGHAGDLNAYIGGSEPTLSLSDILANRRQITNRGGQNFLQRILTGSDIEGKVNNTARQVLSGTLHNLAPETILPDQLYSLYASKGINAAKAAGATYLINKLLPGGIGGILSKLF